MTIILVVLSGRHMSHKGKSQAQDWRVASDFLCPMKKAVARHASKPASVWLFHEQATAGVQGLFLLLAVTQGNACHLADGQMWLCVDAAGQMT